MSDPILVVIPSGATEALASRRVEVTGYDPQATTVPGRVNVEMIRDYDSDSGLLLSLEARGFSFAGSSKKGADFNLGLEDVGQIEALAYALLHAVAEARRLGIIPTSAEG